MDLLPSPHPLTPPRSEEDWVSWFRLLRSRRVGPTTFHRLVKEHGTIENAIHSLPIVAQAAGVENYEPCTPKAAEQELKAGRLAGARPIAIGSRYYPSALTNLSDAPPILWAHGNLDLLGKPLIAMVGARNASSIGSRMARSLAKDLGAAGYVVVSGLARGIDTAAHLAALETGTIAVLGGGVNVYYPAENTVLAQEISEKGLLLSEAPINMRPQARHFPARNRIISGLASAVVVVEAAAKSGSLITAKNALDQGRDVLAVPGHPFDGRASGCNNLLRDGATLVRNAQDVIDALPHTTDNQPELPGIPLENTSDKRAKLRKDSVLHTEILSRLSPTPIAEDQLIRDLKVTPQILTPELLALELEGKIDRKPGGLLTLA